MQRTTTRSLVRIRNLHAVVLVLGGAVAAAAVTASCLAGTATFVCESGRRCPAGQVCAADQDVCITEHGCGDGIVEPGEVCDDGNIKDKDGCSSDCKSNEQCGNNIVDNSVGEICDDGNTIDGDGCSSTCFKEECGNGRLDPGEVCDDGNTASGDGCSADCKSIEACGNGIVDAAVGEQCEFDNKPFPHHFSDSEICDNDCTNVVCGDGHTNTVAGEKCDPGMMVDGQAVDSPGCNFDCTFVRCGDSHINHAAGEECDDGDNHNNNTRPDACRKDCHKPACGDGVVDPSNHEQCDPGTMIDGHAIDSPDCNFDCTPQRCGDGYANHAAGEECDDGDGQNSDTRPDACRNDCHKATCGDGVTDPSNSEECDDGNSDNTDNCTNGPNGTCKQAFCGDGFVKSKGPNVEKCDFGGQKDGIDFGCDSDHPVCVNSGSDQCAKCVEVRATLQSAAEGVTARPASQR